MKDLFGNVPEPSPTKAFDGATYDPEKDHVRLSGQLGRVYKLMQDGHWRTLSEIYFHVSGSQAGISARLRDLRKAKYGAHTVERRRVGNGLFQYRVTTRT